MLANIVLLLAPPFAVAKVKVDFSDIFFQNCKLGSKMKMRRMKEGRVVMMEMFVPGEV